MLIFLLISITVINEVNKQQEELDKEQIELNYMKEELAKIRNKLKEQQVKQE
jgi:hypothetical protein